MGTFARCSTCGYYRSDDQDWKDDADRAVTQYLIDTLSAHRANKPQYPDAAPDGIVREHARDIDEWSRVHSALCVLVEVRLREETLQAAARSGVVL